MDFLKGTGVAIITPFKKNGEIDFNAYEMLIDFYINNGISYLVILGTTGESHSISFDEKVKILKSVVKFNKGRLPLIVGFGSNNTQKLVNEFSNFELENNDSDDVESALSPEQLSNLLVELKAEMENAAKQLDFERAARLRDRIFRLEQLL